MARRTKAQVRADKIAATEARLREEEALLRELKREAAKAEKAEFDAAVLDFGRWLASEVGVDSVEKVAALREALSDPEDLDSLRAFLEAPSTVADDRNDDDGNAVSGTGGSTETDTSEQREDGDGEERSSSKSW